MTNTSKPVKKRSYYVHPSQGAQARVFFEKLQDDELFYGRFRRASLLFVGGFALLAAAIGTPRSHEGAAMDELLAGGAVLGLASARLFKHEQRHAGREIDAYLDEAQDYYRFYQAEAPDWLERALAERPSPTDINLPQ